MNRGKTKKRFTKWPMVLCSFRISVKVKELWQAAAAQEEDSQSEFLRKAIRYRAKQVLLAEGQPEKPKAEGER